MTYEMGRGRAHYIQSCHWVEVLLLHLSVNAFHYILLSLLVVSIILRYIIYYYFVYYVQLTPITTTSTGRN